MIYIIIEIRGISVVGIGILVSQSTAAGMVRVMEMGMGMGRGMGKVILGNRHLMPPVPVSLMTCELFPFGKVERS
jgi:hypothetical protein